MEYSDDDFINIIDNWEVGAVSIGLNRCSSVGATVLVYFGEAGCGFNCVRGVRTELKFLEDVDYFGSYIFGCNWFGAAAGAGSKSVSAAGVLTSDSGAAIAGAGGAVAVGTIGFVLKTI